MHPVRNTSKLVSPTEKNVKSGINLLFTKKRLDNIPKVCYNEYNEMKERNNTMAKTMNEYYKELLENIPTPETLQQMKVAENVEKALARITEYGYYRFTTCNAGSRTSEIAVAKKVIKVFSEKGYQTEYSEYSEKNRDGKIFWAAISI